MVKTLIVFLSLLRLLMFFKEFTIKWVWNGATLSPNYIIFPHLHSNPELGHFDE